MIHQHNYWAPFGNDRPANQAAQDALQTAADLAAARRKYEGLLPHQYADEFAQREEVDRLSADLSSFADRGAVDRELFRETLQRKVRRDDPLKQTVDLTPLAPHDPAPDMARRALEGAELERRDALDNAAKWLASWKRIHGERLQAHLAAERALRAYDQARKAGA